MTAPTTPNDITRQWTIMVYFAGQNRLFDEMVYQLKELKEVNPDPNRLALLAQFATKPVKKRDVTGTNLPTPRRFDLVTDDQHPAGSVAMNLVEAPESARSGESEDDEEDQLVDELVDFIVWGIKTHQAKRYMVVFGGDGGGVLADFLPSKGKPPKGMRPRKLSKVFLRVRDECKKELKTGKIDIVGLDACLMSMTEICYGLRDYADFLVSSEGNEDDLGWPYTDVFEILNRIPDLEARELASHVVTAYNSYYLDYALIADASANLSAVDLGQMENLARAVSGFTEVANLLLPINQDFEHLDLPQQIFVGLLVHAHWVAQTYRQDQYTDVGDFFTTLRDETKQIMGTHEDLLRDLKPIVDACDGILVTLGLAEDSASSAIVSSCNVGVKYQYSTGLSMYLPWSHVDEKYFERREHHDRSGHKKPLEAFALATGWGEFLLRYVEASRRPCKTRGTIPREELPGGISAFMRRDPPDGRGSLPGEHEGAKNPPSEWNMGECVATPFLDL